MKASSRRGGQQRGYPALLNLETQPHWTIFLTDFALPLSVAHRLRRQLKTAPTAVLFIRINAGGVKQVMQQMRSAGIDVHHDYISLQGVVSRQENLALLDGLFERLPHRDLVRVDVPALECGFRPSFATHSLDVVMRADYVEQDQISDRFFRLLARCKPYEVTVETPGAKLQIRDSRPWFALAGRLRPGEARTLPDGEVAYSADEIREEVEGKFVVDGAVLPIAQHPRFAEESLRLLPMSREVSKHPLCLEIRRGKVVGATGKGRAPKVISSFFERNERYRQVTEVGISFNRASTKFIHDWPAASNEVRPGVHLGIGGAANPDDDDPQRSPIVHIDCIAANCKVLVNGQPFLRASS